jgi:PGF-CTERM protein
MKKKIIAGLIAIVAIVALGTVPMLAAEPTLPPGYTWYEDEEFKFKIGYPEGWTMPEGETTYGEGLLGGAEFTPGTPGVTLQVLVASEFAMDEFKAMNGTTVMINGREGYDVTHDFEFMVLMRIREVAFAVEDRYYVITCTALAENYDDYADAFEIAIKSFVIEYPTPVTPPPAAEAPEEGIPGFETVFAIAGLLAVAYLLRRRE